MTSNPLLDKLCVWQKELKNDCDSEFLLDGLTFGFKIMDLPGELPESECANYKSATCAQNFAAVENQIRKEISLGRYYISDSKPRIISAIGAVPKPDSNDIRLIHDCSRPLGQSINSFASVERFSFETIDSAISMAKPGFWLAKVDLKSAYRHVAIHPSQYPATGLKFRFTGEKKFTYLYHTRLMFGASRSVGIFHRITQSVVRMMRKRGFHSTLCYLDDFLVMGPSQEKCQAAMDSLVELLCALGFTINWSKVVPPTQRITFLGIEIDMTAHKMFIPMDKLSNIKSSIAHWLNQSKVSKKQLQSIIGSISWGAKCIKAIRPILRSIIDLQASLQHAQQRIRLPMTVKNDLRFFYDWCVCFNGVSFTPGGQRFQPDTTVFTDASLSAGAAYNDKDFYYCAWPADFPNLMHHPIYIKELCAILLAFHRWPYKWRDKVVMIYTDNRAAEWAIRKGLSKNPIANNIIREILWIAASFNITISVSYIRSKDNCIADALSRMENFTFLVELIKLLWSQGLDILGLWITKSYDH